jgi:hypothetical protein
MSQTQSRRRNPRGVVGSNEAFVAIVDAARVIQIRNCLTPSEQNRVHWAAATLDVPQQSKKRQQYRMFLHDVCTGCGPHGVLLCAVGLGQHKIITMRKMDRAALVAKLVETKNQPPIESLIIQGLASDHGISTINGSIWPSGPIDTYAPSIGPTDVNNMAHETQGTFQGSATGMGLAYHTAAVNWSALGSSTTMVSNGNMWNLTYPHESMEYPSLEEAAAVFDACICNMMQKVNTAAPSRVVLTVTLPSESVPIVCLMSLRVYEWAVEFLAQSLFDFKVKRVDQIRHIISSKELQVAVSGADTMLRGAQDEALIAVFGFSMYEAMNGNFIRRKEIQEGKARTDCVSMVLLDDGAIINISLDWDNGLKIRNKLYTYGG